MKFGIFKKGEGLDPNFQGTEGQFYMPQFIYPFCTFSLFFLENKPRNFMSLNSQYFTFYFEKGSH